MGKFPLDAALSAGSSLIGSLIGGIDASKSRQWQTREREAAQRYNTSEREASQLYNTSERESSQAFQTSEREAQNAFSEYMYNQYSSPQALAAQYSKAGLNPRLAMDGSSVGNATAGSGSSGGAPSGSAPSGTHVGTPSAPITFGQGFQDMAASFAALAQAKKAGVDAKLVEDTAQDIAEGYKLDNAGKKLVNSINTVDLSVKQQTALRQALATLTSTEVDADKKRKEIDVLVQQGIISRKEAENWDEEFVNRQSNIKSQTAVNEASANRTKELLPFEKGVLQATEWVHRTQAALNRLATGTEIAKASYYSELSSAASYDADIKKIDAEISKAKKPQKLQLIDKQVDMLTKQLSALDKAIEKAQKENDWFVLNQLRGLTKDVSTSIYMLTQIKRGLPVPAIDIDGDSSMGLPYN